MKPTWSTDESSERLATEWMAAMIAVLARMGSRTKAVSWPMLVFPDGGFLHLGPEEFNADLVRVVREKLLNDELDEFMLIDQGVVITSEGADDAYGLFHYDRDGGLVESWAIVLEIEELSHTCPHGVHPEMVGVQTVPVREDDKFAELAQACFL